MSSSSFGLAHPLRRLTGRDPHEPGRVANTLELLYDLTYVVAFSIAGSQFAHMASNGEWGLGVFAYSFMLFATIWAWINATWFSSAFDNDDWGFRVLTMVQMVGVVVFAFGIGPFFASVEESHGQHVDVSLVVAGYIIMRLALAVGWLRVAVDSPKSRKAALIYVAALLVAQLGWVGVAIVGPGVSGYMIAALILIAVEFAGPILAERLGSNGGQAQGTPWHPHHVAERYGLLFIITLGEGVVGTVTALSEAVATAGWSTQTVFVVIAGITITFALWWAYFGVAWGDGLAAHPERGFEWGYGHIPLLGGVAAIGAGLHVIAYVLAGHAAIGPVAAVLSVVIPIGLVTITKLVLFNALFRTLDLFHGVMLAAVIVILGASVVAVINGSGLGTALLIAALAPVGIVIAYETVGHRHQEEFVERAWATSRSPRHQ